MPELKKGDVVLKNYTIERLLGKGAFGEVYLTRHANLNVLRALKILRKDAPGMGSSIYNSGKDRFFLEAQLGARLKSEYVVEVHDFQQEDDDLVLVMEYAAGGSLAEKIERNQEKGVPIPVEEMLKIAADVSTGLAALHQKDIVHRDLKPSNILFDQQGHAKVADLGLAQVPGASSSRSLLGSSMGSEMARHPGTPAYMSPEQESTYKYLTLASDVYSLGLIFFELLTGRSYKTRPGTRVKSQRADVPEWLDGLVAKMLEEDPRQRPLDANKVLGEIQKGLSARQKLEEKAQLDAEQQKNLQDRQAREQKAAALEIAERQKAADAARKALLEREEEPRLQRPERLARWWKPAAGAAIVLLLLSVFFFAVLPGMMKPLSPSNPTSSVLAPSALVPSAPAAALPVIPSGKVHVGIVLPTKDEPRWIQDENSFQDAFKASGYDVQILFSQGDSAREKANVESLISQGIKVLILCPQDASAAAAAADEARAAGVKVISYDRLVRDTASVDYYVTFDSIGVGKAQAQYLVDHAAGKGNPLYLYAGAASDNNAFIFFEGAWSVLQPRIADGTFVIKNASEAVALQNKTILTRDEEARIIGQVTTNWDFNAAKSLAESNLTTDRAADKGNVFILAPNDGTARAIADTFAAGIDVKSFVITGQDAEKASIQYIILGKQSMTVYKDTRVLAKDAITAAVAFLTGRTPDKTTTFNNGNIDVPAKPSVVVTVDRSNLKQVIIDSGQFDLSGLGFPAAVPGGAERKSPVGIVLPTKDEPRWIQDERSFQNAFKEAGIDVQILFSQGDSGNEKQNIEFLISQGIKVLILCPQDASAAASAVDDARAAGVKVISYDRLIRDTASVDYYVTFDSIGVGKAQAQYLVDHAAGKGNPLYLYAGAASDNNAFVFFEGAWSVLQPRIADGTFVIKNASQAVALQSKALLSRDQEASIIGQVTTNWDPNAAKSLAESNLAAVRGADKGSVFVLAPNDGTARAIADTFAADRDVRNYVITGQDAEKASVQYIIDGKQSMTVFKDTRVLAKDAIAAALAFLTRKFPDKTTSFNNGSMDVPAKPSVVVTVDRSNIQQALINSGAFQANEFTGLK